MSNDLFEMFPKSQKADWIKAAQSELKGADPIEKLSKSIDGLDINAYYDISDQSKNPIYKLPVSSDPFLGPRAWHNLPLVSVSEAGPANKIALKYLASGADGLVYHIKSKINIAELLEGVQLPYCSSFFMIDSDQSELLSELDQFRELNKFEKASVKGGVIWKSLPENLSEVASSFQKWDNFFVLGHAITNMPPIDALATALQTGVDSIDLLTNKGLETNVAIAAQAFSFEIGSNFFMEIAKLKAFRRLWLTLVSAYDTKIDRAPLPFIHAISTIWNEDAYNPNANMLKSTTAAIASIVGGCDGITILPEKESHIVQNRIARNVSNILREESYMHRTADPIAGSYYIESLIEQMAEKAWEKFKASN